jgi:hypothetical protein
MRIFWLLLSLSVSGGVFVGKPPIDLRTLDFNQEPQEWRQLVPLLNRTFQILRPPTPKEIRRGSVTVRREAGQDYTYGCSGSFLPNGRVALATHCFKSITEETFSRVILRRHRWMLDRGRLTRIDHEDFRFDPRRLMRSRADATLVSIQGQGPRQVVSIDRRFKKDQRLGRRLLIVGYPTSGYAQPFGRADCRLSRWEGRGVLATFFNDCGLLGGMSGGPQFDPIAGKLLGANASSRLYRDGRTEAMAYLLPWLN